MDQSKRKMTQMTSRRKKRTKAPLIFAVLFLIYYAARKFDVVKPTIFSSSPQEEQPGKKKEEEISVSAKQQQQQHLQPLPSSTSTSSTTALRIQIVSDLHIEFYGDDDDNDDDLDSLIVPQAPILALVGDIGYACSDLLRKFLLLQSDRFEKVLFLAGNHEYYNNKNNNQASMTEQNECMKLVCDERDNLYFMEKDVMVINDVTILGTTLWSDIPRDIRKDAERSMNDYHRSYNHEVGQQPRLLTATETSNMYKENVAWLKSQLEQAKKDSQQKKVIILTHHTPLLLGTSHPRFNGSTMTHCFSTDLIQVLEQNGPPVVAWACGHTHYNFDLMVGNVRVISNQRGYKDDPKNDYQEGGVVLEVHSDS